MPGNCRTCAEFGDAFAKTSDHLSRSLAEDAAHRDEQLDRQQEQFTTLWQQMQTGLQEVVRAHDAHLENSVDQLTERLGEWQQALAEASQVASQQLTTLGEHTVVLTRLADQEEHLARLQEQLAHNLEAVRTAETFEQSLHNLTAAVHLLTARTRHAA